MNSAVESAWTEPAWSHESAQIRAELTAAVPHRTMSPTALLHRAFLDRAAAAPAAPAVIGRDRTLTYGELAAESATVAAGLTRQGIGPGALVGVSMDKGWEQVVACLGVLRSGAAYVPVDPRWPEKRRHDILAAAGITTVLTQPWLLAGAGAGTGAGTEIAWPESVSATAVTPPAAGTTPAEDAPVTVPAEDAPAPVTPSDLAYVIYTSGSTGVPKGVMIEHGAAWNTVQDVNEEIALTAADRVLALSALHFDLSVYDIFGPLSVGGAVVIPSPDDAREPGSWLQQMTDEQVTVWNSVPALMAMLCAHTSALHPRPAALPPLRRVLMSGDWVPVSLPAAVWDLFPDAGLWSLGGATEASIWSIWHRITPSDAELPSIPYGTPMKNQHVYVADSMRRPRPCWVPGEIYIAGTGLARGYLGDAERTADSFVVDPETGIRLYRTGDWGRLLPDGEIEFLGREDMQVKVGGHRIELGDVEAALLDCPGVRAAVAGVHGDRGKNRLLAHVLLEPECRRSGAELRRLLTDALPHYMIPAVISVREEFPLTANGKVDRVTLGALHDAELTAQATVEGPADAEEKLLLDIWSTFFAIPEVSVTDNFFELGGDSLQAVRLMSVLRRETGTAVPVAALFSAPTIRELAQRLRDLQAAGACGDRSVVVPVRTTGSAVPLVFVHPIGGEVLCYSELAPSLGDDQPFYALQSPDWHAERPTLERMAADYAEAVVRDVPGRHYRLGGWSMGGVLAMELARELTARGRTVDFVAAVDVLESPDELARIDVTRERALAWLGRDLAGLTGRSWPVADAPDGVREPAGTGTLPGTVPELFDALRAQHILSPDIDLPEFEAVFQRFEDNARALCGYRPRGFDIPVHFLQAEAGGGTETAESWRRLCPVPSDIHLVPGDHYTVLKAPNLEAVATHLRTLLTG
ncbi:amino acid adenylation domain-containing protein [Streptomyces sp. NPDC052496]|uniref:amino acid adenylation domain-containing protein n=1 Tax=Streptomyces sp. NPDC052496 TaxID=3154951 RepID=UPI003436A307